MILPDEIELVASRQLLFEYNNQEFPIEIKDKWLLILLRCVFIGRKLYEDPLGVVELIYSDFNYLKEIDSFVKYMPAIDGYTPSIHSFDENISRLYPNWESYIKSKELIYLK